MPKRDAGSGQGVFDRFADMSGAIGGMPSLGGIGLQGLFPALAGKPGPPLVERGVWTI